MLGEQWLEGRRYATGEYVDGDWVEGAFSDLRFKGSIQPLTPRQAQQLPEAWRTSARWKLYTRTKLNPVSVDDQTSGDRVFWDGKELLVVAESNQSTTPKGRRLRHYRYALVEPEMPEEP